MDSGSQAWTYLNTEVDPSLYDPPFSTPLNDPFMSYDCQSLSLNMNVNLSMGEPDLISRKLSAAPKELSPEPRITTLSPRINAKSPEQTSFSPTLIFPTSTPRVSASGPVAEPANDLGLISSADAAEKAERLERERDPSGSIERSIIKQEHEKFATELFPNHPELRDRLKYDVIFSDWWLLNEKEPHGVLHIFIERLGPKSFKCKSCTKKLTRVDRAVDHFRTHIHHRPYTCQGKPGCGDVLCKYAFYTRDCRKSHCSKHERVCDRCGTKVEDKNLSRHQLTRKCKRYSVY